jgi:hypothetical protein
MLFKIIIFLTAAIPVILFVRSMFFRGRPNRLSAGLAEFKRNVDLAVWIFLGLIGCVVVFALGHLAWTWWAPL